MNLYCWTELTPETLNPLVTRQVIHTGNMTLARLRMKTGAVVPRHHHVNEQVTNVESGILKVDFDDHEVLVEAGQSLEIPPNVPHAVTALTDAVALDVFTPAREDWIRGDDAYLRGTKSS
jgi:quercetin dioxygenase-like cupin family protein